MSATLINQLVMIFLLAAIGYIAKKRGVITAEWQTGLSTLVLNIALPATILAAAGKPMEGGSLPSVLWVLAGGFVYHILAVLLGVGVSKLLKLPTGRGTIFMCLVAFSNVAFIGYPIISIFLPDTGIFFTTFFIISFNLIVYTFGMARISGQKGFSWRTIFGINTIASLLMVLLYVLQVRLPSPVQNTLEMLGSLCTPLSMLIIGSMLADVKLRQLFTTPLLYLSSLLRLIVLPTLVFFAVRLLGAPQEAATVLLVMSALPAASVTAIMAQKFGREAAFASQGVLHSTLLFAGTIFYISFLVTFL